MLDTYGNFKTRWLHLMTSDLSHCMFFHLLFRQSSKFDTTKQNRIDSLKFTVLILLLFQVERYEKFIPFARSVIPALINWNEKTRRLESDQLCKLLSMFLRRWKTLEPWTIRGIIHYVCIPDFSMFISSLSAIKSPLLYIFSRLLFAREWFFVHTSI